MIFLYKNKIIFKLNSILKIKIKKLEISFDKKFMNIKEINKLYFKN